MKKLGPAFIAVLAMIVFVTGSASATTLESAGVARNESVRGTASLASGTSAIMSRTDGSLANTCTSSNVELTTSSPFTGQTVAGPVDILSFENCERPITAHKPGIVVFEHVTGTTNGTISSAGAEVTVGSIFGTLNCKTGTGVDIGTLTGVKEGSATLDVNSVLNCGFLVPSARLQATYTVGGPLGVVS